MNTGLAQSKSPPGKGFRGDDRQRQSVGLHRLSAVARKEINLNVHNHREYNTTYAIKIQTPSGFDYLRVILALGIMSGHSALICYGKVYDPGIIGGYFLRLQLMIVPMFFGLSGFLVARSLERSKTLITFLGLRAFRIVPALSVEVFLSALILGSFFTTKDLRSYFSDAQFYSYFLNVIGEIHYQLPGVFRSNPDPTVNGQLWTIPWELVCYIALAALAASGVFYRRHLLLMSLIGLYVAQIGNSIIRPKVDLDNAGGATVVVCFVAGLVIYRYREKIPSSGDSDANALSLIEWRHCPCG